jgi:hypothetical protein
MLDAGACYSTVLCILYTLNRAQAKNVNCPSNMSLIRIYWTIEVEKDRIRIYFLLLGFD